MTVGLFSAVLTAPLAPMRMVLWIAESLAAHAEADGAHRGPSVQERLMEIDDALAAGEITAEQAAEMEDELLARLDAPAAYGPGAP
ncbi:MAG TPA: gas vesicle protein GvpG [Actinoplanes sp.]|jgi:polyhydroxyalkanoate synthesis regulator phasin